MSGPSGDTVELIAHVSLFADRHRLGHEVGNGALAGPLGGFQLSRDGPAAQRVSISVHPAIVLRAGSAKRIWPTAGFVLAIN